MLFIQEYATIIALGKKTLFHGSVSNTFAIESNYWVEIRGYQTPRLWANPTFLGSDMGGVELLVNQFQLLYYDALTVPLEL